MTETRSGHTSCKEEYGLLGQLCHLPDIAYNWGMAYNETTRTVCKRLCTEIYSLQCSSFFYDIRYRSCLLTSHTGAVPDDDGTCEKDSVEYYRRKRCFSRLSFPF